MTVKLPTGKEEDLEPKDPPADPEPKNDPPAPDAEELARLKEENERLKREREVAAQPPAPKSPEPEPEDPTFKKWQTNRERVIADMQLEDEEFERIYRMPKSEARFQVTETDRQWESLRTNERLARTEAENRLLARYGKDYDSLSSDVRSVIRDLAPEVRQDSARLEKALERHFKAIQADKKPATPPKRDPSPRRIVDSGFEPPNPPAEPAARPKTPSNEIPEEYRPMCQVWGIESEEERKTFMKDEILMDFGNGITFQDPAKGIQRRKTA